MNLNTSPSPFSMEQMTNDHDQHQQANFDLNHQLASMSSSSSSALCHIFFSSSQDHMGYYRQQLHEPNLQEDNHHYSDYQGGSSYEIKNKVNSGLKLTLWKKEDQGPADSSMLEKDKINGVNWMSSKMRLKEKMKKPNQNLLSSSSLETDFSSNSSSHNRNSPIRVCADCNTTKTPLWRSGPKGPKSLCNACGIRQRKARRAMAAAAAYEKPPALKIEVQHKEKKKKKMGTDGHSSQLKKRCKLAAAASADGSSSSGGEKKTGFEDFLIKLSNNLAFHGVFPQDEKDAAILLMALSSGLVHG